MRCVHNQLVGGIICATNHVLVQPPAEWLTRFVHGKRYSNYMSTEAHRDKKTVNVGPVTRYCMLSQLFLWLTFCAAALLALQDLRPASVSILLNILMASWSSQLSGAEV